MRARPLHSPSALLGCLSTVALLASCSGDPPTSADAEPASEAVASASVFSICHRTGTTGTIIQVSASELVMHRNARRLPHQPVRESGERPTIG